MLTSARYPEFMRNKLPVLMINIPLMDRQNIWWQQNTAVVTHNLDENFQIK